MSNIRTAVAAISLSAAGIIGIAVHEGYRGQTYDDGVGVPTIGFGETRGVKWGDRTTVERALVTLGQTADRKQREMRACLPLDLTLFPYEWDAYVSLAYNIGTGAFCRSTVARRLRQTPPDYAGACEAIKLFDRAGGLVWPGLTRRREKEYRLCVGLEGAER